LVDLVDVVAEKEFVIQNMNLLLIPQKAVYIAEQGVLLIADLHLGKVNHFRRLGIPVPNAVNIKNLEILIDLINRFQPERVIFLGDLFHSHYNDEWEALGQVTRHFVGCNFQLVLGNHDIMSELQYERCNMEVFEQLELGTFLLTHEPLENIPKHKYNVCGHIHPGVRLMGKGRQSVTLPCFFFGKQQAILPAFGSFTGYVNIPVVKGDKVFIITGDKVIDIDHE